MRLRRLTAVLVVPFLVLVAGTGGARASFFCREIRAVRTSCCCPQSAGADAPAAVKRSSCCDVSIVQTPAAAPRCLPDDLTVPIRLLALAPAIVAAPAPRAAPTWRAREPDRPAAPPLILLKRAFLL